MTLVTKYFDKNALEFIEAGSFKFGSLQHYRAGESANLPDETRFQDELEGKITVNEDRIIVKGGNVDTPWMNATAAGEDSFAEFLNNSNQLIIQAYILCTSIGIYDPKHHDQILNGFTNEDGQRYKGNSDLTDYAVINLPDFEAALDALHPRNKLPFAELQKVSVECAPVSYDKAPIVVNQVGSSYVLSKRELQFDAVFRKPSYFRAEREFRHVLVNFPSEKINYTPEAAYIHSDRLRESILEIGSI